MFDATKGQQAVTSQIETLSDEFASRFDELPPRQQLTLLQQFNQLLDAPDQVSAFQAGTYAQNAAGQPAAALGTGRPTTNAQEGLQAILDDGAVDPGIKLALKRLLTPSDPDHIPVGRDGTPSELINTRRERDAATAEWNAARAELANERNVAYNGSLAGRLADVTAKLATAIAERNAAQATASGYDQAAARAAAQAVLDALNAQRGKMGGDVVGRDDVKAKLTAFANAVGLRAAP